MDQLRYYKAFGYICGFVLLIISCKKDELKCTNQTGWLKAGHEWVYEFHSPFIFADTITLTVNEEIRPDVFEVSTVADDTTIYAVTLRYMRPCDNDIYISSMNTMDISFISYKVDAEIGDTWRYTLPTSRGFTATIVNTIVDKDVEIDAPAGTFTCLVIHEEVTSTDPTSQLLETNYYLNNEHGLIKVVSSTQEYALVRKNY